MFHLNLCQLPATVLLSLYNCEIFYHAYHVYFCHVVINDKLHILCTLTNCVTCILLTSRGATLRLRHHCSYSENKHCSNKQNDFPLTQCCIAPTNVSARKISQLVLALIQWKVTLA